MHGFTRIKFISLKISARQGNLCGEYFVIEVESRRRSMKRLYKSRNNKVIAGVCGGIAEYLAVDPVLVRLVAVLFFFAGGAAFIAYILGMILIPDEPWDGAKAGDTIQGQSATPPGWVFPAGRDHTGALIIGIVMILLGAHFLLHNIPFFHDYYWRFWDLGWRYFWPSILIILGLLIIFRGARK